MHKQIANCMLLPFDVYLESTVSQLLEMFECQMNVRISNSQLRSITFLKIINGYATWRENGFKFRNPNLMTSTDACTKLAFSFILRPSSTSGNLS